MYLRSYLLTTERLASLRLSLFPTDPRTLKGRGVNDFD